MNHMKEVAEMLGVEIGEEFKIEDYIGDYRYKLTEEHLMYTSNNEWHTLPATITYLLNGKCKVVKMPKPILNKVEKEYLSTVIKPFRNKIEYIIKYLYEYGEYISIIYKVSNDGKSSMIFPSYDEGTTYKGMELCKEYTLEELGL